MKKTLIALAAVALLGCSSPTDIVFGPEPLKQMAEQGDKFKKLPEEDRTLLAGYLTITAMGEAFGGTAKPTAGRTVGEVLVDARAWRKSVEERAEKQKKLDAEAQALAAKVTAEKKAMAEKIAGMVTIAILDKKVFPKNYQAERYDDMLMVLYALENKSAKEIKQIKGRVNFFDATGDKVGDLGVDFDLSIAPGKTEKTDTGSGWRINRFRNGDIEKIADRDFKSMKASFVAESIAFADGQVLKAPE